MNKFYIIIFLVLFLGGTTPLASQVTSQHNDNYVFLEAKKTLKEQLNKKNTIYVISDSFNGGNPEIKSIKITSGRSIKWTIYTYYYTAVVVPKGKVITILDRENCTFLKENRSAPIGMASMFAKDAETTVYIASKKPGNYSKAYRIDDLVSVPSGCTLKFEGGCINNCYLLGSFIIDAGPTTIFDNTYVYEGANDYWINIKWFGAKGNGVTDDTEAIRRAVLGKNSVVVYFPKGQYVLTGSIRVAKTLQRWIGESVKGQDYIDNAYYKNSEFVCKGNITTPYVYAPKYMENLSFFCPSHREGSTALMLSYPYVFDDPHLKDVFITGFDKGLHLENVEGAIITECEFRENNTAIYSMQRYMKGVESGYVTSVHFEDCKITNNSGYAFYKDFFNENEVYAPDRANVFFENCVIEGNAKNTDASIAHKTYKNPSPSKPCSLGYMYFINCVSEDKETFIKAENSHFQFDNSFIWCKSLQLKSCDLVLNQSRFPFCTLVCAGKYANFESCRLDNDGSSIKVLSGATNAILEKDLAKRINTTDIRKVRNTNQIPIENSFSGDQFYDLESRMPVYIYKWQNGENNNELFDALGDRIEDKKSGPTSDRPKPTAVLRVGFMYFDTTLNKPIWWNGKVWVDANGKTM